MSKERLSETSEILLCSGNLIIWGYLIF